MKEEIVKWFSKKKYPCKKNKGEHEWGKPELLYGGPYIIYSYKTDISIMDTNRFTKKYELLGASVHIITETKCIHCGKKATSFLRDKIK